MLDLDGSIERMVHSANFPAWVAVVSAAFFGLVFLLSLLRAERTIANGALAALTFTGLAIAIAVSLRSTPSGRAPEAGPAVSYAGVAALACVDDLAGETTLAACEKALFSAPETVAAAVSYTSARINRLVSLGSPKTADRVWTTDQIALRKAIEHDRYGLVAYVLATRDKCRPQQCGAYSAMTDIRQVAANMEGLIYEGLVARYAPGWSANAIPPIPAPALSDVPIAAARPSSIDYPSAASIPPVSIMTETPSGRSSQQALQPDLGSPTAAVPGGSGGPYVPVPSAAPKKRSAAKRAPEATPAAPEAAPETSQPVMLTPTPPFNSAQ